MNKNSFSQAIPDEKFFRNLKQKVLNWARSFNTFCFLDNHQYQLKPHTEECLIGVGRRAVISSENGQTLKDLNAAFGRGDYWMGHFNYELPVGDRNPIVNSKPDPIGFPDFSFFLPEVLIRIRKQDWTIEAERAEEIANAIYATPTEMPFPESQPPEIRSRLSRSQYIEIIRKLQGHIQRGDCYEINFCQEFFAEQVLLDPVYTYLQLASVSPNPFAGLYRLNDRWLICASPERFLRKSGQHILSQPIKGTLRRLPGSEAQEEKQRNELFLSAKDRAENVMVVDLVRNDLARVCQRGTVRVDELYAIHSFPQVHQMISTISGELVPQTSFEEIIRASFPMGSMTGAPKHRVMELIEQYETGRRGIFSGALGYWDPTGDFDFNVVIRSMIYEASSGYLSFPTGSGITTYSDPEKEWDECQLKATAIRQVLGHAK